jgi:hypothetical protein
MQTTAHTVNSEELPRKLLGRWLNADSLGILAAIACVVHCLALPVMAISLPALATGSGHEDLTHFILAGFVAAFCLFAIVPGYRKHRRSDVLRGMVIGLSLVLFATFIAGPMMGEAWEMPLITVGNLIVVIAHLRNRKLLSTAECC